MPSDSTISLVEDPKKPSFDPRDLAPFETMAAADLVAAVRESSQQSEPEMSFVDAVQFATETIKWNAKWFSDDLLNALLCSAFDHGSATTSSAELAACVQLVIVVTTYCHISGKSLPGAARLLSYGYYQARRAVKLKKLRKTCLAACEAIFTSHSSHSFTQALLDILLSWDGGAKTREDFAQAHGAMTILTKRMLSESANDGGSSEILSALLKALKGPSAGGFVMQEHVLRVLAKMLTNATIVEQLDKLALWDQLIGLVSLCKDVVQEVVEPALDSFASRQLSSSQELIMTPVFLHSERPLPPSWSRSVHAHCVHATPWHEESNSSAHNELLDTIFQRSHGAETARNILDTHLTKYLGDENELPVLCRYYVAMLSDSNISTEAASLCTTTVSEHFANSLYENPTAAKEMHIMLCRIAKYGHHTARHIALKTLMRVRVTVTQEVYLKKGGFLGASWINNDALATLTARNTSQESSPDAAQPVSEGASRSTVNSLAVHQYGKLLISLFTLGDWDAFQFNLLNLSDQLANQDLFLGEPQFLDDLRQVISQLIESNQPIEPPSDSGLTKTTVAVRLVHILTTLVGYHHHFRPQDVYKMVQIFIRAAAMRDGELSRTCVHALTVCCYELPDTVTRLMTTIVDNMALIVKQRDVAMHVLEFMAGLSRMPKLFRNFTPDDYYRVFVVCNNYLDVIRILGGGLSVGHATPSVSSSGSGAQDDSTSDLPQYVYALAHHVITFWYIAMKPQDRKKLKPNIIAMLRCDSKGIAFEDQGLVTLDMMDRVDAEEENKKSGNTQSEPFDNVDGDIIERNRFAGELLITTRTSMRTAKTLITIRRATGIIHGTITREASWYIASVCDNLTAPFEEPKMLVVPLHGTHDDSDAGRTYGSIRVPDPKTALGASGVAMLTDVTDPEVARGVQALDRISALDSHKAAVIYVGEGQKSSAEILPNVMGSPDYVEFLNGLGELRRLKGAHFNAQGLDRSADSDGEHAIVWNNDVTELVYHVTTLMPTNKETDPNCVAKMAHIGNDFVKIIFNNSGFPYNVDTFLSDFNFVNIVITPSARTSFVDTRTVTMKKQAYERFYEVVVVTRGDAPDISSAAQPKVISGASLAGYVRNLALNACIFALLWDSRNAGEYPSSWRARLDQIRRLKNRYGKPLV